ncbi:hypothetical protein ENBRE01_0416 [Enteropsectra breve]|nr:hypothetical protein ENBRE01_0416 [Enteropsectra breve]
MFFATLLIHCLGATEQAEKERLRKVEDDRLFEDIMQNRAAILDARDKNLIEVLLPRPMPTRNQMYNLSEFREVLDREKNAQTNSSNPTEEYNDVVAQRCVVCLESFFNEKSEESLFKKRVNKTHNQLPKVVLCPNPRCSGGRICCTCIRALIKDGNKLDPFKAPLRYFDNCKKRISDQRMVKCPVCRNYLNFELFKLEEIPENANMTKREKLNYIEDLVSVQDKTYWLLETTNSYTDVFYMKKLFKVVYDVVTPKNDYDLPDYDQMLFVNDLSRQYRFFSGCTNDYEDFTFRASLIKCFIKVCTEKLDYPAITNELKKIIVSSNTSTDMLEKHFEDICSAVPIEHADKFSTIYYAMVIGYFEKTKDCSMNFKFIKRWILSKYSFILTGFLHKKRINDEETNFYPLTNKLYDAFTDALHDPRLIDNIVKYKALEFTCVGLSRYPGNNAISYDSLIINLTEKYYSKRKEETGSELYNGIFVNRHGADARRFSYPVYKRFLTQQSGEISSTDFNSPEDIVSQSKLPAFIYDAILTTVFSTTAALFDSDAKKITDYAITYSNLYKSDTNYADFLREAYKAQSSPDDIARKFILESLKKKKFQDAILLFKNLPNATSTQAAIELFKKKKVLPRLIKGIQKFEFVSWENETPIYNMLKEYCKPNSLPALLVRMSRQSSCFFKVPRVEIDYLIESFSKKYQNYRRIGSLAFVCRNKELLKCFKDDLDWILTNWYFASNLHNFYNGIISSEGTESIPDLPFFRMYYAELFLWLDKNISDDDVALKISRMLMVAKLATRDLTDRMEVDVNGSSSAGISPGENNVVPCDSSIFALEKDMIKAVWRSKVGYEAFCALQCYLSADFKKYLEEKLLPGIIAIEGADSGELLKEWRYRGEYRKLLKLQAGLDIENGMGTCGEEEMRKLLEILSELNYLEISALMAIKEKSKLKGEFTDIKYYTENISVLPKHICGMVVESLQTDGQKCSVFRKRPHAQDAKLHTLKSRYVHQH